jgi:hypothetical protein
MRRLVLMAALAAGLGTAAAAQPAGRCTHDTLSVRGTSVQVTYCVTAMDGSGPELPVTVAATYASPRASFTQNATLRFVRGVDSSRVIEDVGLERLGMEGTLHLTLVLRGGLVRIETAMLTPGAVTIK